nr:hypothetical protein [Saccharofermentans sp.]
MVFFISPFRLDPRLRNRIRMLSNEESKILLFQGSRHSEILQPFEDTFGNRLSVFPYNSVSKALSSVGKDDLVYVSTIRGFVETYGAL